MKALTEKVSTTLPNAWGRDSKTLRQAFVVEEGDVGRSRDNFLGYHHKSHTFLRSDVGRIVEVITDGTDYNCWGFGSMLPGFSGMNSLSDAEPYSRAGTGNYDSEFSARAAYPLSYEAAASEGRIIVGKPALKPGQRLAVDKGGRYWIEQGRKP